MKKASDVGASLREIFEDSYAEYNKRREDKIANQRRKIAQINSSIQGYIEQSEKAESNVIDFSNKIEIASQENAALENYLLRAQKALIYLSQSITNVGTLQLSNTEDPCKNRTKVEAYLDALESSNEIEWNQKAQDYAQSIAIEQLDTTSVQNLGIKNVQKIVAQMAKEQKLRRGKKGKKRKASVPETSSSPSKGVKRVRKTEEPSEKLSKKTSGTSRKTRGRRDANHNSPTSNDSNEASPAPNDSNAVSPNADDANSLNADASPDANDNSFNADASSDLIKASRIDADDDVIVSPEADDAINANDSYNDRFTNNSSNNSPPPSNILGVLNIETLLNPMESNPPSRNSPDKEISGSTDVQPYQNNYNYIDNNTLSNHLNTYQNEINGENNKDAPTTTNANDPTNNSANASPSSAAIGDNVSSYSSALNRTGGYGSPPSQSTSTSFAVFTSHITPAATGPLFTATPTPAGFFTTTPVNPDPLSENKRKRKPVEVEPVVESSNDRNKKTGKRKSKKVTQFGQARKVVLPPHMRPRVPQPVCRVCDQVEPPAHDQPSATYIYPAKARESMLLKGRDKVHRMVRCNYCSKWYHLACMNPPRKTMPTGYVISTHIIRV